MSQKFEYKTLVFRESSMYARTTNPNEPTPPSPMEDALNVAGEQGFEIVHTHVTREGIMHTWVHVIMQRAVK